MACTSLKTIRDIKIKQNYFRGQHVASMQEELDLFGDIVYDIRASTIDTQSDQVYDLTTHINGQGA